MGADVMWQTNSCSCAFTVAVNSSTAGETPTCTACMRQASQQWIVIEPPPRSLADTLAEITKALAEASKKSSVRQRPCKRHKVVACQAPCCR